MNGRPGIQAACGKILPSKGSREMGLEERGIKRCFNRSLGRSCSIVSAGRMTQHQGGKTGDVGRKGEIAGGNRLMGFSEQRGHWPWEQEGGQTGSPAKTQ